VKVALISLGCPKNLIDSEIILGYFKKTDFLITPDWKHSDIVIINTCAFLKSAVIEAENWIEEVLSHKKLGGVRRIIVAGCLSQRYKKMLLEKFPNIDGIVGIDNLSDIPKICKSKTTAIKINQEPKHLSDCTTPRFLTTNHYAYLKIADGCDNYCSYCLIPSIRGRFRSRGVEDIVREAKNLAQKGVKELILVAQDTTIYGKDIYKKFSLARLLEHLVKIKDIEWIRILYTHPAHWTDELINVYADNPKICRYVDLPLQHISNKMLQSMNRPYDRNMVERLISKIRRIPKVAIRTSFIVGFPDETEKDFDDLLKFIKKQRFAHLGCFVYSREPGTVAYNLPDQISERIKKERYNAVMSIQQKISLQRMKRFVNKKVKIIIDSVLKDQKYHYIGRTQFDAPEIDGAVYLNIPDVKVGDFITVKMTSAQPYFLIAKLRKGFQYHIIHK
jgi:ribosomal protein S12 methylthiotransferase